MTGPGPTPAAGGTDQGGELGPILHESSVLLVAGPGGVGKTTLAAALAVHAARRYGRRVLLVTVDPARRLADALGMSQAATEPVLIPIGSGSGRLFAQMVDMSAGWDNLVSRFSADEDRDALLANPLYRSLTTRFVQSHDYIALDQLCTLSEASRFDLIVVDTPPSGHAIDILDAPEKMVEFFDSRLLRWLTAPYRSRLASVGARPFLALAERLLGGQFLARIAEFFWLFSRMQPGIAARAEEVRRRLDDDGTRYVLVTTAEAGPAAQTAELLSALVSRGRSPSVLIHNRAAPTATDAPPDATSAEALLADVVDPGLREGMARLLDGGAELRSWWHNERPDDAVLITVPWQARTLTTVDELGSLFEPGNG